MQQARSARDAAAAGGPGLADKHKAVLGSSYAKAKDTICKRAGATTDDERTAAMTREYNARNAKDTGVRAQQPMQFRLLADGADAQWVGAMSQRKTALAMGVSRRNFQKKTGGLCGAFPQTEASGLWLVRRRPEATCVRCDTPGEIGMLWLGCEGGCDG